jgi:hypothetical protein
MENGSGRPVEEPLLLPLPEPPSEAPPLLPDPLLDDPLLVDPLPDDPLPDDPLPDDPVPLELPVLVPEPLPVDPLLPDTEPLLLPDAEPGLPGFVGLDPHAEKVTHAARTANESGTKIERVFTRLTCRQAPRSINQTKLRLMRPRTRTLRAPRES